MKRRWDLLLATSFVFVTMVVLQPAFGQSGADTCQSCGDANGDGTYTISDFVYLFSFLIGDGPAPALCSDLDGYDLITVRDATLAASFVPPMCVTQSKIVAQPTSQLKVVYDHLFPPNATSVTIDVELLVASGSTVRAFDLPFIVKVGGQNAATLSATLTGSNWPGGGIALKTDLATSSVLLSDMEGSVGAGTYLLCRITLGVAASPSLRHVTLEYGELAPFMVGAYDASIQACHYVMVLDDALNAWKPELTQTCFCGDANGDGVINISDPIALICIIFAGCPYPNPACRGDANGDGIVGISDAVYIIAFIFSNGPTPHCP